MARPGAEGAVRGEPRGQAAVLPSGGADAGGLGSSSAPGAAAAPQRIGAAAVRLSPTGSSQQPGPRRSAVEWEPCRSVLVVLFPQ